jgi:protein tyrosine phosphatase (PTP) superfamily phosphohydrolase (DUF442 family)
MGPVFVGHNFHAVLPGRVYRSAQLSGQDLERLVQKYQIRTVINLRGCGVPLPWYLAESQATHQLDVSQEDISLSAGRLPSVHEIRRLVRVLDRTEYPLLLHCRQGADRTGLACVVVLLLQTDLDLPAARRQLGLRFGHVAFDRPACLDWFFDLYADWLRNHGVSHSPAVFRRWVDQDYCPGTCCCSFEPLDVPIQARCHEPIPLRIRVHNTGLEVWHLRQESNAGIHGCFVLKDANNRGLASGRFGMFNADVPPGSSIDLTAVFPALQRPGHYRYLVDMVDEEQSWFNQVGMEPMEGELEVHE